MRARQVEASGAVQHLITLLATDSLDSQELAAHALTGIAAGGKKDAIKTAGGIELLVGILRARRPLEMRAHEERVKAHAADALSEMARDAPDNQEAIQKCHGIEALVEVVNNVLDEGTKARAAGALWRLSTAGAAASAGDASQQNQSIVKAGGVASLVQLAGSAGYDDDAFNETAGALISLANGSPENQIAISKLLVKQLKSSHITDGVEKYTSKGRVEYAAAAPNTTRPAPYPHALAT